MPEKPWLSLALWLAVANCTARAYPADPADPAAAGWRVSLPGWRYEFPRDHGNHPDFKTEWWYFTGNLTSDSGRRFGYQLTFFRQGVIPPGEAAGVRSSLVARNIAFAHFAVSDLGGGDFHFAQRITRGAFGEAGWDQGSLLAWIGDWSCERTDEHAFRLKASDETFGVDLELSSRKPPVFHGDRGASQKAEGAGRASHYYSLTRLHTDGRIRLGDTSYAVTGLSWFDHEWATNQLTEEQVGWDWFSIQFTDGTELMLFQIRTRDGGRDPYSGGTWVGADGQTLPIKNEDFRLLPMETWKSPSTGAEYPVRWKIEIPSRGLTLDIRAAKMAQELDLPPVVYWEGAVEAEGTLGSEPLSGRGYLEMTGYGSPIVGMQAR